MREKTIEYMKLTMVPFEKSVDDMIGQFKEQYQSVYGENLPEEVKAALVKTEASMRDKLPGFIDEVAGIYEAVLTEADLDVLIAHAKEPAEQKVSAARDRVTQSFLDAYQKWMRDSMTAIEPELARLFGVEVARAPSTEQSIDSTEPAAPKVIVEDQP